MCELVLFSALLVAVFLLFLLYAIGHSMWTLWLLVLLVPTSLNLALTYTVHKSSFVELEAVRTTRPVLQRVLSGVNNCLLVVFAVILVLCIAGSVVLANFHVQYPPRGQFVDVSVGGTFPLPLPPSHPHRP